MKSLLSLFVLLSISQFLYGQQKVVFISFDIEAGASKKDSLFTIRIFQKDSTITCALNEKAGVKAGIPFRIEFLSAKVFINPIASLVLLKDTVIKVQQSDIKLMKEVIVKSKKYIVRQTLGGYEYNPQTDSSFYKKSILLALARIPFVRIEMDKVQYKQGEIILFTINGKERPGITNWSDVLRSIKAKDVFKVELITDVPSAVQKRGFTVIINILTADMNIFGQSVSLTAMPDQRKNINSSADITFLQKKRDYSISLNNQGDRQNTTYQTKAFKNDTLVTNNELQSRFTYYNYNVSFKFGVRIDSAKEFSASISGNIYRNRNIYTNTFNFPLAFADQSNNLSGKSFTINSSYLYRKNSLINSYFALAATIDGRDFNNRISFIHPQYHDSLHNFTNTQPYSISFDYSHVNNSHKNRKTEAGIFSYIRHTKQDFQKYSVTPSNEDDVLLYSKNDSLNLHQISISPFLKYTKNFSPKKNLVVRLNTEYYSIKNITSEQNNFILPSLTAIQKNILRNNSSVSFRAGINLRKPGLDFLLPIQFSNNPALQLTGNFKIKPSKTIYIGSDLLLAKNNYVTQSITYSYSYDVTKFFTSLDSSTKQFMQEPDDHNTANDLTYSIDFQKELFKAVSFYTYVQIDFIRLKNSFHGTNFNGIGFTMTNNLSYSLPKNNGAFGFNSFINGKNFTSQGSSPGTVNYQLYYARSFFRKRVSVTVLVREFLKPYRNLDSKSISGIIAQYTYDRRPYRLIGLRIAYNFSNIRISKTATEKKAFIRGEINNY